MSNTIRLFTFREVLNILTVSGSTLRRMIVRGEFPPPMRISQRRMAWRSDAVAQRIAGLDGKQTSAGEE
jgi:predicted DNA-binding transcriptional regulator AlpA